MKTPSLDKVQKAAQLWARYTAAADRLEVQARAETSSQKLAKAMMYRANAARLYGWAQRHHLVKGYAIPKRFKWRGMDISIENPAGSVREWYDPDAQRRGLTIMLWDYGYLRGTAGVDGDKVDVYVGPRADDADMVYVVRQMKSPDFRYYDEDKCMVGFDSEQAARDAYLAQYDNPRFLGAIDCFPVSTFVQAVKATKKAPAPVGGWLHLGVQQRVSDLKELLPSAVLRAVDDTDLSTPKGEDLEDPAAWRQEVSIADTNWLEPGYVS